jgi:general secretion pathway protein F
MVSGVLEPDLRAKLVHAKQSIVEGNSASISFEKHGLTTPIALSLLKVGEKTGRLGDMSEYIADYYDEQTSRWVEWFTKLFEPLLMSAIGIVIGLIVVMMYFPIFELAGSLQ